MSSVFRLAPPVNKDWSESAGFIAASLGLHIALALFFFLSQQPYGVKDGSIEVALTEVPVSSPAPAANPAPEEAAPAAAPLPELPVAEPAEPAVPEETLPDPETAETTPEEPQPEPAAEPPAVEQAQAEQPESGGMPMPRGGQTLFCTHPPIYGLGGNRAPQDYGVLGTPSGNWTADGDSTPVLRFGQDGGPTIISFHMPQYPYNARMQNMEGVVFLALRLDEKGALQGVNVLSSAGYEFDMAAIDAVIRSQFGPAIVDGVPVACRVVLPIRFTLN